MFALLILLIFCLNSTHADDNIKNRWKLECPKLLLTTFDDNGTTVAMITCSVANKVKSLSMFQVKESQQPHVLLARGSHQKLTLNKTLTKSDEGTEIYCEAYFLNGLKVSVITIDSVKKSVTLKKPAKTSATGEKLLCNPGSTTQLVVASSVAAVAFMIIIILVTMILKYKRKVKEFGTNEALRNREPVPVPTPDELYEPVYGHGAGLKRPRMSPTDRH